MNRTPDPGQATSATLLNRIKNLSDTDAWTRFWQEYEPLIRGWGLRCRLTPEQVDEITSRVMLKLVQAMPDFEYDPAKGGFRGWLYRVATNSVHDFWREQQRHGGSGGTTNVDQLQQQPSAPVDLLVDELNESLELLQQALEVVRSRVGDEAWEPLRLTLMENVKPAEAARRLGLSVAAVYNATFRLRKEVRAEVDRLRQARATKSGDAT